MNLAAVNVHELEHPHVESCSGREAPGCRRWLLLAAALVLSGCTLTDDAFEPSPVDRAGGQLNPQLPDDPLVPPDEGSPVITPDDGENAGGSDDGEGGETSPTGEGSEPDLGSVPLDPPDNGGEGSDEGSAAGANSGQNGSGQTDGGVEPGDGEESPEVDGSPEPPVTPPCPGMEFGGSCYQLFGELAAWEVAELRCLDWGGHLASVQSLEEDVFLDGWPAQLGIPSADGSGIWLGGTDAVIEGDFRWWDDSPLSFEGWAPNQPDNGVGTDCIEKRNDGTSLWYDRRCNDPLPFLCERAL